MSTRVEAVVRAAAPAPPWSRTATSSLLQRKQACGNQHFGAGQCRECSAKSPSNSQASLKGTPALSVANGGAIKQRANSRVGHNFGSVKVHSTAATVRASAAPQIAINGLASPRQTVFRNGPAQESDSRPNTPSPTPQAPSRPACPTDIKVAQVRSVTDTDQGKDGILTGVGGFARMEVSDASGHNFDGVQIKESVKQTKNTCGAMARHVCSNATGEGGSEGSTFKVGAESNFLGKAKLAATANSFYDIHAFVDKTASLLHKLGKSDCEVQCEQKYLCGGHQIGPEFLITYSMRKDVVANFYDVTRVSLQKQAKAAPAATPPPGGGRP
jgi:hypothetical protein